MYPMESFPEKLQAVALVSLEISHNSQENTYARVSFSIR